MEDYVPLIWRLVVIFDEIELIVRCVDGGLGSWLGFVEVSVLCDLWSKDEFRAIAAFKARLDGLGSEVEDDGGQFIGVAKQLFPARGLDFFEGGGGSD